ncbi:hypothetical protein [Chryseobacterium mucoviscidosis]
MKRDIFGVNVYLTGFKKVASAPLSHHYRKTTPKNHIKKPGD